MSEYTSSLVYFTQLFTHGHLTRWYDNSFLVDSMGSVLQSLVHGIIPPQAIPPATPLNIETTTTVENDLEGIDVDSAEDNEFSDAGK